MSEQTKPGEDKTGDNKPGETLAALQAEIDDLKRKHDKAFAENRKLKDRIAELEKIAADREKEAHSRNGDIEALRKTFQAELESVTEKLKQKESQLHSVIVEKEIRSIAAKYAVDDSDVWALLKDEFTIGEDENGKPVPVCKNSALSPEKRILQFLESKPHLAKNTRIGGTDTKGAGTGVPDGKATAIPSDFSTWDYTRKKEWMSKNPHLAAEAAMKALGG